MNSGVAPPRFCHDCGASLRHGASFCSSCGASVQERGASSAGSISYQDDLQPHRSGSLARGCLYGVAAVFGVLLLMFAMSWLDPSGSVQGGRHSAQDVWGTVRDHGPAGYTLGDKLKALSAAYRISNDVKLEVPPAEVTHVTRDLYRVRQRVVGVEGEREFLWEVDMGKRTVTPRNAMAADLQGGS